MLRLLSRTALRAGRPSAATAARSFSSAAPAAAPAASEVNATAPVEPLPETRVQASLKLYHRHLFIASSRPYAEWASKLETGMSASPGSDAGETRLQQLAVAMKRKEFTRANPLPPNEAGPAVTVCPHFTLFDVSGSTPAGAGRLSALNAPTPFAEGDLVVLSGSEAPVRVRTTTTDSTTATVTDLRTNTDAELTLPAAPEVRRLVRILDREPVASSDAAVATSTDSSPADFELLAFVCCHANRDARCGERGPALVDELHRVGSELALVAPAGRRVRVRAFPCSHIGGHEFAGNVLFYGYANGEQVSGAVSAASAVVAPSPSSSSNIVNDWFGLIAPSNIAPLLRAYTSYLSDVAGRDLSHADMSSARRALLSESVRPSVADSACPSCDKPLVSAHVSKLAHLWRGTMDMERADTRAFVKSIE